MRWVVCRLGLFNTILFVNDFQDMVHYSVDFDVNSPVNSKLYQSSRTVKQALSSWQIISFETSTWVSVLLSLRNRDCWSLKEGQSVTHDGDPLSCSSSRDITMDQEEIKHIRGGEANSLMYYTALCSGVRPFIVKDKKNKVFPFAMVRVNHSPYN